LIQLEHEKGIPRNPFINAGAIADILVSCLKNPKEDFLFYKTISGSPTIDYNFEVAQSEKTLVLEMLLLIF
jgi:glutaminase